MAQSRTTSMTEPLETAVDVTGEAAVLPHVGADSTGRTSVIRGVPTMKHRARELLVVRESDEYGTVLLQGMIQQTIAYAPACPAMEKAKELGISPLVQGSACGIHVWNLTHGRAKAALFEIDGCYFLYAMASAAKSNAMGENDWTHLLVGVLEGLRPITVQVAALSRLVRSFDHASLLLHAVTRHVDEVRAGSTVMRMRGEGMETGQLMWTMLATVAASERNLIVQRLTAGMVSKYNRGEWIKGNGAVPLGYRLDPVTKTLKVDPEQADALKTAWTLLADPEVRAVQVTKRLGEMGVSSAKTRLRHGEGATIADVTAPNSFVRGLMGWSELYLHGRHLTRWLNPFEGAPHVAGMPVHRNGDREELHFAYQFDRPDLDPALIRSALSVHASRADAYAERGGAARDRVPPLNQVSWLQDHLEYWLAAGPRGTYEVRVRGRAGDQP